MKLRKDWMLWEEYGVVVLTVAHELAKNDVHLKGISWPDDIATLLQWQINARWISEADRIEQAKAFIEYLSSLDGYNISYDSLPAYLHCLGSNVYGHIPYKFWEELISNSPL